MLTSILFPVLLTIGALASTVDAEDEVRVVVASNFAAPMTQLAALFEEQTGHRVVLSFGSTGKHYAQIRNGAPFDAFFAADVIRPRRLEEEGFGLAGTRFVYAVGRLVLWSRDPQMVDSTGQVLRDGRFRFLAIANPDIAPYGRAARQVLEKVGQWDRLTDRIVRGENVAQAFQFAATGNADLGFVAYSLVLALPGTIGSTWMVPGSFHSPIRQEAILLTDSRSARSFMDFVRTDEARRLILASGYDAE